MEDWAQETKPVEQALDIVVTWEEQYGCFLAQAKAIQEKQERSGTLGRTILEAKYRLIENILYNTIAHPNYYYRKLIKNLLKNDFKKRYKTLFIK